MTQGAETLPFRSKARQLLDLMIHSLYSHKEIFLRELISNASDALDKLRIEALRDKALVPEGHAYEIRIEADREPRRLRVVDTGVGMSRDDLVEQLGTIARSGTREYLAQLLPLDHARAPRSMVLRKFTEISNSETESVSGARSNLKAPSLHPIAS